MKISPAEYSLCQIRRSEVSRYCAYKRHPGVAALCRKPTRRHRGVPRDAAHPRHGTGVGAGNARPHHGDGRSDRMRCSIVGRPDAAASASPFGAHRLRLRESGSRILHPSRRIGHGASAIADDLPRDALNAPRHFGGDRDAEKVVGNIRRGSAPLTIRWATRCARVLVFPEPAPAMTRSGGPGAAFFSPPPCSTACRCSRLRLSR